MKKIAALFFLSLYLLPGRLVSADEFTSSSFRIVAPVIAPAGFATSSSFQLWGTIGEIALGTSSASSFQLRPGFLSYPFVSTPAVSSTAGDAQVALSWTASEGFLGWIVGGYSIGQGTVGGGPYSYSSVGNVTSSTRTGLTNGTAYYFVIVTKDTFGNFIATSTEVSRTPVASPSAPQAQSGGGGGGGGYEVSNVSTSGVVFSGRAYPGSSVFLIKDGQVAASTLAGPDAIFKITLTGLSSGSFVFILYAEDQRGRRSSLLSYPITLTKGATSEVSGIFITPTIAVDKSEVKRGDNLAIFGQSVPDGNIIISVHSDQELFVYTSADKEGSYLYNFDSSVLEFGTHLTKAKASKPTETSPFGKSVSFAVGTKTVLAKQEPGRSPARLKGEVNGDGKVNLVDFSIVAFWYKKPSPPARVDLNGDGKVSLIDFSILVHYWTG